MGGALTQCKRNISAAVVSVPTLQSDLHSTHDDLPLELPATATREDLLKAMDSHIKAACVGRFHATPQ